MRLFEMFDLFIKASAFTERTKKESAGTLVADWGIVSDDSGLLIMFPREIIAKMKFFKKMEIVFVIASEYFATRKGQIIFVFFHSAFELHNTINQCLQESLKMSAESFL